MYLSIYIHILIIISLCIYLSIYVTIYLSSNSKEIVSLLHGRVVCILEALLGSGGVDLSNPSAQIAFRYLSIYLSIYLTNSKFYLFTYLTMYLSIYLSIYRFPEMIVNDIGKKETNSCIYLSIISRMITNFYVSMYLCIYR
jgi:dolichyl-phosphate-mannose--protein O-mannosyl transferase